MQNEMDQVIPDYKRVVDYLARTGQNGPDHWEQSLAERKAEGLPCSFPQDVFDGIHKWYGRRSSIQPPHVRDLLSNEDRNFQGLLNSVTQDAHDKVESEPKTRDPSTSQR